MTGVGCRVARSILPRGAACVQGIAALPLTVYGSLIYLYFPRTSLGDAMAASNVALLQGTLDVMILKALSWRPLHGYGVTRWLQHVSEDALHVEEGSLYPALHRLEQRGWVTSEWGTSENNRRAKYYSLTPSGRRRLRTESTAWERFATVVAKVLAAAHPLPR